MSTTTTLALFILTATSRTDANLAADTWTIDAPSRNNCVPHLVAVRPGKSPAMTVALPPWCEPVRLDGRALAWGENVCGKHVALDGRVLQPGSCIVLGAPQVSGVESGDTGPVIAALLHGGEAVSVVRYGVSAGPWPNLAVWSSPVPADMTLRGTGATWEPAQAWAACPTWTAAE